MAKYVVYIYDDQTQLGGADAEAIKSIVEGHEKFAARHGGSLRGGGRLAQSAKAVSLPSGSEGSRASRQGAFLTDAKHHISGYYIIEAGDIDEAVGIASDVPAAFGGVEVRELI
jgi:hypothetical protein